MNKEYTKRSIWSYGVHIIIILLISLFDIIQGDLFSAIYILLFLLVCEKLKEYLIPKE